MDALQQGGVSSSSSSSSSSRLPTLSSISLFAVNNDDDDKDLQYLKDNKIRFDSVKYLRYIRDNEAALLAIEAYIKQNMYGMDMKRGEGFILLERTTVYLELLRDGTIRPATKRLKSSRVEDAMDCLSCLDRKTISDEDCDFDFEIILVA